MTANVMFPLSLVGSTMNVTNLLTATNVGIGTTSANYPLTVSNTAFGVMELNRISTTTTFYGAGTVYTVTDPANNNFKGKYAYAFGGAKILATTSQSQADGYYAIDVANSGLFGSDTTNSPSGAMFYMDSVKTYFQNTALGVGTTSPSWPLTVAKDLSFAAMTSNPLDAALVIKGNTNTGTLKIGTYYTGVSFGAAIQSSQFVTGNDTVAALILNPLGGNVGIGTASSSFPLDIWGGSASIASSGVTPYLRLRSQYAAAYLSVGSVVGVNTYIGLQCGIAPTSILGTPTLVVTNAGTVGIGKTNPSTVLDVSGSGTFSGNLTLYSGTASDTGFYKQGTTSGYYMSIVGGSTSNSPYLEFFAGAVRRLYLGFASTSSVYIHANNSAELSLGTEDVPRLLIDTTGNVTVSSRELRISQMSSGQCQFRIKSGSVSIASMFHCNGTALYFLCSDNGNWLSNYNTLRPLTIELTTGAVSMAHGLSVTGTVTATAFSGSFSGTATNATYATSAGSATYSSTGGHIANQIADLYDKISRIMPVDGVIRCGPNYYLSARALSGGGFRYANLTYESALAGGFYGSGYRDM
jgi:hypothetical protein